MNQNQRPTLLEWLNGKSLSNLYDLVWGASNAVRDDSDILEFANELEKYGLSAFEKQLTADQQYSILSQYVEIYR